MPIKPIHMIDQLARELLKVMDEVAPECPDGEHDWWIKHNYTVDDGMAITTYRVAIVCENCNCRMYLGLG